MQGKSFNLRISLELTESMTQDRFLNIIGLITPEQKQKIEQEDILLQKVNIEAILNAEYAFKINDIKLGKSFSAPVKAKKMVPLQVLFNNGFRADVMMVDDNMEDAIILAKSTAIKEGYSGPRLSSITSANGPTIHYCCICGKTPVNPDQGEDTCYNCVNS